jgi:hypothetical protein
MSWSDIRSSKQYSRQWVALNNVRYDPSTAQPLEADVVDVDEDLADLCARVRESDRTACAIVFCDEDMQAPVVPRRASPLRARAAHH